MYQPELISRFLSYVEPVGPCWLWAGAQSGANASKGDGYGMFWDGKRSVKAHRFSYVVFKGEIPEGLFVCHVCNNKPCVRPDHLTLGTHRENMRQSVVDGLAKGPRAKRVPESLILAVRNDYLSGTTLKKLAQKYNVSPSTVWRYVNGRHE